MNREIDGWTDGRTDAPATHELTDVRTNWRMYELTDGRTDRRTNGQTDGRTDGRMDGRTEGRTDGWRDGRTDGRRDGSTQTVVIYGGGSTKSVHGRGKLHVWKQISTIASEASGIERKINRTSPLPPESLDAPRGDVRDSRRRRTRARRVELYRSLPNPSSPLTDERSRLLATDSRRTVSKRALSKWELRSRKKIRPAKEVIFDRLCRRFR